ncbi:MULTISPECIES: hypothetical protein [unclassified Bradyrhizobium]|uniref:hypothetical protein n=1 Tax=unclassified Bradyrhizobium TaxID=2631580 RepID=UPI00339A9B98
MRTIKAIPTVMLAVSLGTGVILASEAACARDGGHQGHNDRQDHYDRRGGNAERVATPQSAHFGDTGKRDRGKVTVTKAGAGDQPADPWWQSPRGPVVRQSSQTKRRTPGSIIMKCLCNVQDKKTGGIPQQEFTEDQFFEQFAALEEGLALIQIQLRDLSDNAKLFGSLVRHMRRSACPVTLSPK